MRYVGGPWTPMIFARVTDIKFDFTGAGAKLEVNAEDLRRVEFACRLQLPDTPGH